jgi:CDP-glucose 4,6-dehydratase
VLELLKAISKSWDRSLDSFFEIEPVTSFHEAGLLKLNCDKALYMLQWKPVLEYNQTAQFTGNWYNTYYNKSGENMYEFTCSQLQQYEDLAAKKELAWIA